MDYPKLKYRNKFFYVGNTLILTDPESSLKVEKVGQLKRIVGVLTNVDDIEIPLI